MEVGKELQNDNVLDSLVIALLIAKKKIISKCRLLKSSAANNCLTLLMN